MTREERFKLYLLQNGFEPDDMMQLLRLHPSLLDIYSFEELAPLCLLSPQLMKRRNCYVYLPEFLYQVVCSGSTDKFNKVLEQLVFKEFSGDAVDVIDSHLEVAKEILGR